MCNTELVIYSNINIIEYNIKHVKYWHYMYAYYISLAHCSITIINDINRMRLVMLNSLDTNKLLCEVKAI